MLQQPNIAPRLFEKMDYIIEVSLIIPGVITHQVMGVEQEY